MRRICEMLTDNRSRIPNISMRDREAPLVKVGGHTSVPRCARAREECPRYLEKWGQARFYAPHVERRAVNRASPHSCGHARNVPVVTIQDRVHLYCHCEEECAKEVGLKLLN